MSNTAIILYITGSFRSGSTILDNTLGQIDGFCAVGELRSLWENGLLAGRICGCGVLVRECPFWNEVQRRAFGDDPPLAQEVVELQHAHVRTRPRQLMRVWQASKRRPRDGLKRYLQIISGVYRSISEVSGASVIVDSSKVPADVYSLTALTDLDVRVLHLVRDPRGVAHSWSNAKPAPDAPARASMEVWSPIKSSVRWLTWNAVLERCVRPSARNRYMLLRYEDLAADPRETLRKVCEFAGASDVRLPFEEQRQVLIRATHSPSGNPDRLNRSHVAIAPDERWRQGMKLRHRLMVSLGTLPLLHHYGYRVTPSRQGASTKRGLL